MSSDNQGLQDPDLYFETPEDFSRRNFAGLAGAASLAAAASPAGAAELQVTEMPVESKTPDGTATPTKSAPV